MIKADLMKSDERGEAGVIQMGSDPLHWNAAETLVGKN